LRQKKAEQKLNYVGEKFYDDEEVEDYDKFDL
jgi:hypothetical protein